MKKHFNIIPVLIILLSLNLLGCQKNDSQSIAQPDIIVEDMHSADSIDEPSAPEESEPLYWWDLYDYNSAQEVLPQDGEFKNLTLQPGNHPDELYVTWFSKSASRGKVTFEIDGLFSDITAKATTQESISVPGYYRNSALITGLESNQTYTYRVSNGSNKSPYYVYETGDLYATDFTFTIAGDPEIGLGDPEELAGHRNIWRAILNRVKTHTPDASFIITTGDQIAKADSTEHYDYFLDNSVLYSIPLVPVVGNHDSGTGYFGDHFSLPNMSSIGQESGNDGDYWFVKGSALFMVINNMCPQPTEVHEQFVAEAIEANPNAKWRIVISHYSPITMVERYLGCRDAVKAEYAYMGEVFDVDLFIGGHDHIYTRGYFLDGDGDPLETPELEYEFHNPESPVFVIFNGSTDALLREPEDYPWAAVSIQNGVPQLSEVHVTDQSLTITTHDADSWATVDSFTIYKE